jgi:hypothetical protein
VTASACIQTGDFSSPFRSVDQSLQEVGIDATAKSHLSVNFHNRDGLTELPHQLTRIINIDHLNSG